LNPPRDRGEGRGENDNGAGFLVCQLCKDAPFVLLYKNNKIHILTENLRRAKELTPLIQTKKLPPSRIGRRGQGGVAAAAKCGGGVEVMQVV
jgi:hypothetical protein